MTLTTVLDSGFYARDSRVVARELLGCMLVHRSSAGTTSGIIVETEAYRPDDPACHAYSGPTPRNSNLFGPPGTAYVYRCYGVHNLFNVVCEAKGVGSAVLVRSLRPLEGQDLMRRRRGDGVPLCLGPGRLTQAFGIRTSFNGRRLDRSPLWIEPGEMINEVITTTRIGLSKGREMPWRYIAAGEEVSRPPGA